MCLLVLPPSGMEQAITSPVRGDFYENLDGNKVLEIFQNVSRLSCPSSASVAKGRGSVFCLGDSLSNLRTTLPRKITVDGRIYVLVDYALYKEGASHFTYTV